MSNRIADSSNKQHSEREGTDGDSRRMEVIKVPQEPTPRDSAGLNEICLETPGYRPLSSR